MAKPCFTPEDMLEVVRFGFGLDPEAAEPLPSYDDQNARVVLADGSYVVLKLAASGADCRGCIIVRVPSFNRRCYFIVPGAYTSRPYTYAHLRRNIMFAFSSY
jgi:hypothetical protein